jgi:hypothetical protein
MPRLRVSDDPTPELSCPRCRAEAAALVISATEQALFRAQGRKRRRWRELRADAIQFAADSRANTQSGAGPLQGHQCIRAKER